MLILILILIIVLTDVRAGRDYVAHYLLFFCLVCCGGGNISLLLQNSRAPNIVTFIWLLLRDKFLRLFVTNSEKFVHSLVISNKFVSLLVRDECNIKKRRKNDIVHLLVYPLPPGLIMTTEKVTNHNNQCPPPSLRKWWQIQCLRLQKYLYLGESLLCV